MGHTSMTKPLVSVLLPVYNAQDYLRESIDSILGQTFADFELIIINDGSTDGSKAILDTYSDPRIVIIDQANAGLPISLNRAIAKAKGKYLARQDADDVSLPTRLAEQVAYLEMHPECALLGTWAKIMRERKPTDRELKHPTDNGEIQVKLMFYNCFVHSSVVIRKATLNQCGVYPEDPEKFPPEDYDLWLRIAQVAQVANLPKVLLQYRELPGSISRQKLELMQKRARKMSEYGLTAMLGNANYLSKIALLVEAMCAVPVKLGKNSYLELYTLLENIAQHQLARWPGESASINRGLQECQSHLKLAYDKSRVRSINQYLPFDLYGLLKKLRR
jgi:glycosyltransferase involved in cell wall biosynthesis